MDKGYGKVKYLNLKDVKFMLACTTHKSEPPLELEIEFTKMIPRCPKCQPFVKTALPALTEQDKILEVLQDALKKLLDHAHTKDSPVELRIEFPERAIKERDR